MKADNVATFEGKQVMTHQHEKSSAQLKGFLFLVAITFAAAATLLIFLSTSAATVTGRSPFMSVSLVDGVNTGILGPGEQRWFRLKPGTPGQVDPVEQSLTLIYTPGGDQTAMQIFEETQLQFFYPDDTGQMANLGAGQIVHRDNNPQTGELYWTGWLPAQENYYIQVMNGSDATVDYWLLTDDIYGYPLGPADTTQSDTTSVNIETPSVPATGSAPYDAIVLNPGYSQGHLETNQEIWYEFSITDSDSELFEEAALTMFITPGNDNRVWNVGFDIFTAQDIQNWLTDGNFQINNIGAGSVVNRDKNPLTGERFWTGWIIDGEVYYVKIRNNADTPIDYWFFTGDVFNPELGGQ